MLRFLVLLVAWFSATAALVENQIREGRILLAVFERQAEETFERIEELRSMVAFASPSMRSLEDADFMSILDGLDVNEEETREILDTFWNLADQSDPDFVARASEIAVLSDRFVGAIRKLFAFLPTNTVELARIDNALKFIFRDMVEWRHNLLVFSSETQKKSFFNGIVEFPRGFPQAIVITSTGRSLLGVMRDYISHLMDLSGTGPDATKAFVLNMMDRLSYLHSTIGKTLDILELSHEQLTVDFHKFASTTPMMLTALGMNEDDLKSLMNDLPCRKANGMSLLVAKRKLLKLMVEELGVLIELFKRFIKQEIPSSVNLIGVDFSAFGVRDPLNTV